MINISTLIKRYHSCPKSVKSTIWFTICNLIVAGLGFITAPLFTRLLSPEEYGKLTLFLSYEQIFLVLSTWEMYFGAYQKGIFKYKGNVNEYTRNTLFLTSIITLLVALIFFAFYRFFVKFTSFNQSGVIFLFLYLLFIPGYYCWIVRNRTIFDYRRVVLVSLSFSLLSILASLIAVLYIEPSANSKFISSLFIGVVFGFFFYFRSMRGFCSTLNFRVIKSHWSFMIVFQFPLVLHALSYYVLNQADRIMIGKIVGVKESAFYGVAYTIATLVTILQNSLNQALTPWRYHKLEEKNYQIIGTSTNLILLLFGAIILLFIIVVPEFFMLIFPSAYYESIWCIPPVSLSVFFIFLYSVFVNVESYYEETKYIMFVSVSCALFNIIANFVCIPIWGYIACAYTTLISYILFALFHYLCVRKILNNKMLTVEMFNVRSILFISFVMIFLCLMITFLYSKPVFRYSLFIVILLLIFKFRYKFLELYQSVYKINSDTKVKL